MAYEWSGLPLGSNLHRNVIFRNEAVPALPTSYYEAPTAQGLWAALQSDCHDGTERCDVLAIPHNSNLGGGMMFAPVNADGSPLTAEDAAVRAAAEPLVEIMQHKGESECRLGVGTSDELCGFEKVSRATLIPLPPGTPIEFPPLNFVRNVLKEGLLQEENLGVNPFKHPARRSSWPTSSAIGSASPSQLPVYALGSLSAFWCLERMAALFA